MNRVCCQCSIHNMGRSNYGSFNGKSLLVSSWTSRILTCLLKKKERLSLQVKKKWWNLLKVNSCYTYWLLHALNNKEIFRRCEHWQCFSSGLQNLLSLGFQNIYVKQHVNKCFLHLIIFYHINLQSKISSVLLLIIYFKYYYYFTNSNNYTTSNIVLDH